MIGTTEAIDAAGLESLVAQVADEFLDRKRRGERPTAAEYADRYPAAADLLGRVLAALEVAGLSGETPAGDDGSPRGVLGDFRILREVGRGGMGIVYEAEQISLDRRVALKVLPFAATMDPKQLQRFHNEAKAAASLYHEHIVHVYGVGCERGVHYFAMQFVDGHTLADVITVGARRGGQAPQEVTADFPPRAAGTAAPARDTAPIAALSTECTGPKGRKFFRRCAELIADAADALEHAHSLGIVHRDVKPGNLLLDHAGKVYVSDFGLARFGPDAGLTVSGDLLGTLRYMAPEQALARHGLADHRVDIYGLGATLYELLTGQPAVGGTDKADIVRRLAFEEAVALRKLDRAIPAELETVALKCLAKNPAERYATAGELAADLRRWLGHQAIKARPPSVRQRLDKLVRRHSGAVVAAAAALLLGAAVSSWLAVVAWTARQQAETDRDHARAAERAAMTENQVATAVSEFVRYDLIGLAATDAQANLGLKSEPDLTVKAALNRAAEQVGTRFRDQPRVEAAIRRMIGFAYWRLGESSVAIPHLERAVALMGAELGLGHEDTLDAQNILASAYLYAARYADAIALFQQTLPRSEAVLGPDAHDTLLVRVNLAEAFRRAVRLQEATAILEPALKSATVRFGVDDLLTLVAMANLSTCYTDLGRPNESVPLAEQALARATAALGPDHPETILQMGGLAGAYFGAGRVADSVRLQEAALPKFRARIGPDHPDTIIAAADLGRGYLALGRRTEAIPLLEKSLEALQAKRCPDEATTLNCLINLATAREEADRGREAITLLEPALEKIETVFGPEHPKTLAALSTLGNAYWFVGRERDAVPLHERVLRRRQKVPGPDHPDTLRTVVDLTASYINVGRSDDALRLLEPLMAKIEAAYGPDSGVTLTALNNFALALSYRGRLTEAVKLNERVLGRSKAIEGPDTRRTVTSTANLASNYLALNRPTDAIALLEPRMAKVETVLGANRLSTLSSWSVLAEAYRRTGQVERSLPLHERTFQRFVDVFGPESFGANVEANDLALNYYAVGRLADADALLEPRLAGGDQTAMAAAKTLIWLGRRCSTVERWQQTAAAWEKIVRRFDAKHGPDHADTLTAQLWLAEALDGAREWDKGIEITKTVVTGREKLLGPDHPDTLDALHRLEGTYRKAGRRDESLTLVGRLVERSTTRHGPDHPDTLAAKLLQAEALDGAAQWEQGADVAKAVVASREKLLGPDHPDTVAALRRLEGCYRRAGRWPDDEAVLHELVKRTTAKLGPDHPDTHGARRDSILLLINTDRLAEAIAAAERLRDSEAAGAGGGTPSMMGTLNLLAQAYHLAGRLDDADRAFREQLALQRKQNGPESPPVGNALGWLGMNLLAQKRYAEAEPVLRDAARLYEKHGQPGWQRGLVSNRLGAALVGVGREKDGAPLLVGGYEAMNHDRALIPGPWKRYFAAAGERVAQYYEATGRADDAKAVQATLPDVQQAKPRP